MATLSEIQARRSNLRAASLCLIFWSVSESERLFAGIAFDQDTLHSRGIIKRPTRLQTGRSSVDAVETIAEDLVRGWVGIVTKQRPCETLISTGMESLTGSVL